MFKKRTFFLVSVYAFVLFCITSYFSVMYSLSQSIGNPSLKTVSNIGFPFLYYEQFWVNKSNSPNCGWHIKNFFYDFGILWIATFLSYTYFFNNKTNTQL